MARPLLLLAVLLLALLAGSARGASLGVASVRRAFYLNNDARDLIASADWSYAFNTQYIRRVERVGLRFPSAWTVDAVEARVDKEATGLSGSVLRVAQVRACVYNPAGALVRASGWTLLPSAPGPADVTLSFSSVSFASVAEARVLGCSCVYVLWPFFLTTCDRCPGC